MEIQLFTRMLRDKHVYDWKRMRYKYPQHFSEFMEALEVLYYKPLPLPDFGGKELVVTGLYCSVDQRTVKHLLRAQGHSYSLLAAENEIIATSAIENIDFGRESVRRILRGMAPVDEQETRILGVKNGLAFIADPANTITEENLHKLYQMTVGDFLGQEERLAPGRHYRHDNVFVVSDRVEHTGMHHDQLPDCMQALLRYAALEDGENDLMKAAVLHFYVAYLHPWFDGNGRMARLLHLWFLVQKGYQSTLFIPFSSRIEKSRKAYYNAFTMVEENKKISGRVDVTPFIQYFVTEVYNQMCQGGEEDTLSRYREALMDGRVTPKEAELWKYVLSAYGTDEFSTKQLEKEYGNAAYATIRGFVKKFEEMELLASCQYGSRKKYRVI